MNVRDVLAILVASVVGVTTVASAAPADLDASGTPASNFSVNPVQVSLSPAAPSALLSLSNRSDQPQFFQLSAFEWQQVDREQVRLTPTDDVIFLPALVRLAPGEKRQVLIAADTTFGSTEKSYRLVVQKLPSAGDPVDPSATAKMPTRMTIPVFLEASHQLSLASVHGIRVEGGKLSLNVENRGATHFIVDKIVVHGIAQDGESLFERELSGGYVLAGRTQTYDLLLPEGGCAQMAAIALEVRIGKSVLRDTIETPSSMCAR
ncbi:MAG: fimbria/pilus periplasmic chaperone [Vicinamibacterales bacterium]